ncbi:MAG TPA: CRISPR-associated primase-polymerase type A1, partial [bacterium]|nr:CRISPR-associated primase-polymerase type A1 [bacterium]
IRRRKRDELAACQYITVLMCDDLTPEQSREALEFLDMAPDVWDGIRLRIAHAWAQIPEPDAWRTLAEVFAEAGAFDLAQMMDARSRGRELPVTTAVNDESEDWSLDSEDDGTAAPEERDDPDVREDSDGAPETVELTDAAVGLYMKLFRGRDGIIGEEYIDERGNKSYHQRDTPLTQERLAEHFAGERTLGLYIMQPNDTVNLCLLDIDVKKRFILTRSEQGRGFEDLLLQAHAYTFKLYDSAKSMGVQPVVEDSGYKGRHLWLFFAEPLAPSLARQILAAVRDRTEPPPEAVAVEMFPSRDHAKKDTPGDLVKLPLGRNRKSGRFARFINRDGSFADPTQALHGIRPVTRAKLKQLMDKKVFNKKSLRKIVDPVDIAIGDLDGVPARGPVRRVVKQCHLMRFFISKAQKVGHLTHMERVAMLHVFGHLEDEGRAFLHRVMAFCMNYDPNYTQAQIGKLKPSPISCPRLKETFPQISNSVKCNCHFGSLKDNAYPSPVLWADEGFFGTAPVSPAGAASAGTVAGAGGAGSRPEPGDAETPLQNEADELVKKYMNIRNNFRGVQKAIHRLEDRLVEIMKQLQVDAVETSFGVLRCIESDGDRPRFIIEI